jgi:hypothetical protein
MEQLIQTHHPELTIGELHRAIEAKRRPVRRSPHIGNIPSKDLAVMTGLPPGVEVLMVNTIQGDDKVTKPYVTRLSKDREVSLTSRSAASGRVIGAVAIKLLDQNIHTLPVAPTSGQSIADYHQEALGRLQLSNQPINMMDRFNQHPDMLRATLEACKEQGCLHRRVGEDGKIHSDKDVDFQVEGIYGIHDSTPTHRGVLLPLNGMMTIDMLLSEEEGSPETLHLGGGDMVCYTRDAERMQEVGQIKSRAAALLGRCALPHCYIVQDCRGLAVITPEVSQHELLLAGRQVDPSEHLDKPCGTSDE